MFTLETASGVPTTSVTPPMSLRRLGTVLGALCRYFATLQQRRIAIVALQGMSRQGLRDIALDRTEVLCSPHRPEQRNAGDRSAAESAAECEAWARHAQAANGFGNAVLPETALPAPPRESSD
ncbi:hypothetical protein [Pelagibius sp.]|uniref:hypothetical protein n=1 Tax=Pelagibius sp. TaxID=1931238 RepID=UPI00260CF05C|nr:hypothetical protein [Pelagibius sp.]